MSEEIMNEEKNNETQDNESKNDASSNSDSNSGSSAKTCAVLAYLAIGVIWHFLDENMRKDSFAKFHVKQALGLIIADIVLMVVLTLTVVGALALPAVKIVVLIS